MQEQDIYIYIFGPASLKPKMTLFVEKNYGN